MSWRYLATSRRRGTAANSQTAQSVAYERITRFPAQLFPQEGGDGPELIAGRDLVKVLLHDGRIAGGFEPYDDCAGSQTVQGGGG